MRNQSGLTLAEMLIAITIGAIIIFGAVVFLYHMITAADENKAKSFVSLQVQYVGFWLNEDAAQAQMIDLGGNECTPSDDDGFPLVISWGNSTDNEKITYDLVPMEGEDGLSSLYRNSEVYQGGQKVENQSGTHLVAEYIDSTTTRCYRNDYGDNPDAGISSALKSLCIEVAADIDGNRAESNYEIFPRSVVRWFPQVDDPDDPELGAYRGPPCPTPSPSP